MNLDMNAPTPGAAVTPVKKAPRSSLLRSCERCRKRKIRCDEFFPCATCTRMGIQCKVPNEDRKNERSQSYLEQRVKRLESLLAQRDGCDEASNSRPESPFIAAGPSTLQLQIPSSPLDSCPQESDLFPSHISNSTQSALHRSMSYCSSPVDYPSTPSGELPPWCSTEAFDPNQSPVFEFPRRANSFPFTSSDHSMDFNPIRGAQGRQEDNMLSVPDIPVIEVTSWDQQSNASHGTGYNDLSFDLPDLSVGSWSIPPSPSLTALSHGQDEFCSEFDFHTLPRRSSIAFSDRSTDAFDYLKPAPLLASPSLQSRPRSRSDVLPHSIRSLQTSTAVQQPSFPPEPYYHPLTSPPTSFSPNSDDSRYARTFFDHIYPFYPILSPQILQSYVSGESESTEQQATSQKLTILLILAIGSQYESNINRCSTSIPEKYFSMAQQLCSLRIWQQTPSLRSMEINLLLAVYDLLSTPSLVNDIGITSPVRTSIWMLNALISASALDLNLHQRADLDDHEMDLFSSAYVLDKTIGSLLGRPHILRDSDIHDQCLRRVHINVDARRMKAEALASEQADTIWKAALQTTAF